MTNRRRTRNLPAWILAIASIACGLVPGTARAEEPHRLAAFAFGTDNFSEKAASVINHLARENFIRASQFDLVDMRGLLLEDSDDPRLGILRKADQLLKSGKEQYDNLELDAAIEELNRAVVEYRKAAGRLGTGEGYLEALLYLGAAYILSGDNEQGVGTYRKVALFDKRKALDPKVFPPSMIEIFNKVKDEVSASPVGTVQVKSTPAAGEVYLNGVFKGITPVTLVKVPEGTHFVRVERDGYLPWGQRVDFFATHEETTEATLQAGPKHSQLVENVKRLVEQDLEEDPPGRQIVEFGEWLRADRLALVSVKQRGDEIEAEAAMIQLQPPKTIAYRSASFNLTSANFLARADAFVTSLYRDVKLPPAGGEDKKPPQPALVDARCNSDSDCSTGEVCDTASGRCIPYAPEGEKFYEKWWFWAIVGGGLAVAGGTTFLVWYLLQPEEGAIAFTF